MNQICEKNNEYQDMVLDQESKFNVKLEVRFLMTIYNFVQERKAFYDKLKIDDEVVDE